MSQKPCLHGTGNGHSSSPLQTQWYARRGTLALAYTAAGRQYAVPQSSTKMTLNLLRTASNAIPRDGCQLPLASLARSKVHGGRCRIHWAVCGEHSRQLEGYHQKSGYCIVFCSAMITLARSIAAEQITSSMSVRQRQNPSTQKVVSVKLAFMNGHVRRKDRSFRNGPTKVRLKGLIKKVQEK